ncbi:hypothetical protein TW79_14565 [Tritonibacter mobilis]|nr:hypothetical protein TW79_14565 [Tritonibacter mobilis]
MRRSTTSARPAVRGRAYHPAGSLCGRKRRKSARCTDLHLHTQLSRCLYLQLTLLPLGCGPGKNNRLAGIRSKNQETTPVALQSGRCKFKAARWSAAETPAILQKFHPDRFAQYDIAIPAGVNR